MIISKGFQKSVWTIFIFSLLLLIASCDSTDSARIYLDTSWQWAPAQYRTGEFKPLSDEDMHHLANLIPGKRGYIVLRNTFSVPQELKYEQLGVYIGKLDIAALIFVNDFEIGKCGQLPPKEFSAGYGSSAFSIPTFILHSGAENTIEIKVWVDGEGRLDEYPFIGKYDDVANSVEVHSFFNSRILLLFEATMMLVSIFYLFLYLGKRTEKEFLYYGLTNFSTLFYLVSFFQSESKWMGVYISQLIFNKIFLGVSAFVTVYFATSFIRAYFEVKDTKKVRVIRLLLMIVPILDILLVPSYQILKRILPVLFIFVVFQLAFAIIVLFKSVREKLSQALLLLLGFSPVLLSLIADLIIHVMYHRYEMPFITLYGWQFTIIMFLLILSKRYGRIQKEVEFLNAKLEAEVVSRTRDLTKANTLLEKEKTENAREMNLAVHVQQSFYPHDIVVDNGWDVAVYFQPMAGVSGDLYDFYLLEKKLRGMALFDVSGHGIAAGLVTMLSKNVIFRAWKSNMGLEISDVMEKVNDAIIKAKGGIENYMTGILLRMIDEESGDIELVNAGNPTPLLYRSDAAIIESVVSENQREQYGMIGIAGMKVSFQSISVSMQYGDSLIFYTDGITESQNQYGDEYGVERLSQSFLSAGSGSSEKKLACVLRDFMNFIGEEPQKDDVTIIILTRKTPVIQKKINIDDIEELEEIDEVEDLDDGDDDDIEELEELEEI